MEFNEHYPQSCREAHSYQELLFAPSAQGGYEIIIYRCTECGTVKKTLESDNRVFRQKTFVPPVYLKE